MYFVSIEIDSRKNLCTIDLEKLQRLGQQLLKWYFVSKLVLTYCEKICSSDRGKTFEIRVSVKAENFAFVITRTIFEQGKGMTIFETEYFFNLFLVVSQIRSNVRKG